MATSDSRASGLPTASVDAMTLVGLAAAAPVLGSLFKEITGRNPLDAVGYLFKGVDHGISMVERHLNRGFHIWNLADVDVGRPFVDAFFATAIGVKVSELTKEQERALDLYRRFIGFAITVPLAVSSVAVILKGLVSNRLAEGALESVARIPEEMGISWALGMMLDRIVEQASGQPINEFINESLHPARIEWPVLRSLARQHVIDQPTFDRLLSKAGFDAERRKWIKALDTAQLTPGEIQTAFMFNLMSEKEVVTYLRRLGYSDSDAELQKQIYIDRAITPVQQMFTNELRAALVEQRITEKQYRAQAANLNVPQSDIDLTVKMVEFELGIGRVQQSVTTIKKLLLGGNLDADQAKSALLKNGYAADDAQNLVTSWYVLATGPPKPLSNAKIVTYLKSGVLTRADAYAKLQAGGMQPQAAQFLIDHPDTKASTPSPPYSVETVQQAYYDDIIDIITAQKHVATLTGSAEEAKELTDIWLYIKGHKGTVDKTAQAIDLATAHTAYMAGSLSDAAAISIIDTLQYSPTDAQVIWASWYTQKHGTVPTASPFPT